MNFTIAATQASPRVITPPPPGTVEHRKLVNAAQQFEGMLLQEMLKPMKEHGFGQEEGEDDADGKDAGSGFGDTLNSFGAETMATAIAKGGGLGIAKHIVEQVEREKTSHDRSSAVLKSPEMPK